MTFVSISLTLSSWTHWSTEVSGSADFVSPTVGRLHVRWHLMLDGFLGHSLGHLCCFPLLGSRCFYCSLFRIPFSFIRDTHSHMQNPWKNTTFGTPQWSQLLQSGSLLNWANIRRRKSLDQSVLWTWAWGECKPFWAPAWACCLCKSWAG